MRGWLIRQMELAKNEIESWPQWKRDLLRREIRAK